MLAMAALQPCPSGITAPARPNLRVSRWQQPRCIMPLDRTNTMLKIRPISHGIRAHSASAGQSVNPDLEERMHLNSEEKKIWEKVKNIAKGPPDMPFREEIDIIDEYWDKARDEIVHNESILHANGAALSCTLCSRVHHAAVLASKVVDCAALRLGSPDEISLHTTTQKDPAQIVKLHPSPSWNPSSSTRARRSGNAPPLHLPNLGSEVSPSGREATGPRTPWSLHHAPSSQTPWSTNAAPSTSTHPDPPSARSGEGRPHLPAPKTLQEHRLSP